MSVYKRKGRGWYVDVTVEYPDGTSERKRKKSPLNTKRDAEAYERDLRAEMLDEWRKKKLGLDSESPTLADFEEEFFAVLASSNAKQSTVDTYRTSFRVHLVPFFGEHRLDAITPRTIEAYKASRSHLAAKTVRNHLGVLSKALRIAVRLELLDHMPQIDVPGTDPNLEEMEVWGDDEEARVLAAVDTEPRIANWIRLALATGLRSGELAGLQWGDVDLVKRQLVVRRQWYKGRITTPKSNRLRTIPLSAAAIDALERQKPRTFLRSFGTDDWVFSDEEGFMQTNRVTDGFNRIVKAAEVKRIRIHDMRHTFASKAVRRGVPIEVLQKWMGHSDIRVTMRYAHFSQTHTDSFIDLMGEPKTKGREGRDG